MGLVKSSGLITVIGILLIIINSAVIVDTTKCPHCGKDFKSVGHHAWRCPSRPETDTLGPTPRPPLTQSPDVTSQGFSPEGLPPSGNTSLVHENRSARRRRQRSSAGRGNATTYTPSTSTTTTTTPTRSP